MRLPRDRVVSRIYHDASLESKSNIAVIKTGQGKNIVATFTVRAGEYGRNLLRIYQTYTSCVGPAFALVAVIVSNEFRSRSA